MDETNGRRWLIWDNGHGAWWAGQQHGYTLDLAEARRYGEGEARDILDLSGNLPGGTPSSVMVLEPTGSVPAPLYTEIADAARVLAAASERAAMWISPEMTQLISALEGRVLTGHRCPACAHRNTHVTGRGCAAWVPNSAADATTTGHRCGCLDRQDVES